MKPVKLRSLVLERPLGLRLYVAVLPVLLRRHSEPCRSEMAQLPMEPLTRFRPAARSGPGPSEERTPRSCSMRCSQPGRVAQPPRPLAPSPRGSMPAGSALVPSVDQPGSSCRKRSGKRSSRGSSKGLGNQGLRPGR